MKRARITTGALVLAAGLAAVTAGAGAVEESIKARQALMTSQGVHLGALAAIAKGEAPFTELANGHAFAILKISGAITGMFPEGSGSGDTRAKAEIWSDWAKFEQAAADLTAAAGGMVEAAKTGDPATIGAALGKVGATCGGCHKPFRTEQN